MRIWKIEFSGYYPVGAVAIVATRDNEGADVARAYFLQTCRIVHPNLEPEDGKMVVPELISVAPGDVHILQDGNY